MWLYRRPGKPRDQAPWLPFSSHFCSTSLYTLTAPGHSWCPYGYDQISTEEAGTIALAVTPSTAQPRVGSDPRRCPPEGQTWKWQALLGCSLRGLSRDHCFTLRQALEVV